MRTILPALAVAAFACKQAPAPAEPPPPAKPAVLEPERIREREPNDYQRAQQIPARAIVEGSIAPPRPKAADDDWYRVATDKALVLSVELKGAATSFEVYDRDRNRIARAELGFLPAVACPEACFVKVSGTEPGPYTLTVLGGEPPAGVEVEPNDRAVDATLLEPGRPVRGTFHGPDDEDWYRLVLPAAPASGQFVRVEVLGVERIRTELEVRAVEDGALLASFRAPAAGEPLLLRDLSLALGQRARDAADAGAGETRDAGVTDGGEPDAGPPDAGSPDAGPFDASTSDAGPPPSRFGYFFVLRSSPVAGKGKSVRAANPRVPYTISARLESGPTDLEQEPNDDLQHATPLAGGATGFLSPAGDQDWYRIHLEQPMVARIELSGADRADLEFQVFAAPSVPADKPALLARASEVGPRETEIVPSVGLPAGDSFVLVQAAARQLDGKWLRDGEDPEHPYKLTVQLSPDDGSTDREPNNDPATGQKVTLPLNAKGTIWPRKDVDVYLFHVEPGRPPVNIRLGAVRGVDLMLRLFEIRGGNAQVIGSADQQHGEGEEQLLSVPLKEGDYGVEVSSPRNKDASATQPYQLTVQ